MRRCPTIVDKYYKIYFIILVIFVFINGCSSINNLQNDGYQNNYPVFNIVKKVSNRYKTIGTAFLLFDPSLSKNDTYVVTAYHVVISNSKNIYLSHAKLGLFKITRTLRLQQDKDIAFLFFKNKNIDKILHHLKPLRLYNKKTLRAQTDLIIPHYSSYPFINYQKNKNFLLGKGYTTQYFNKPTKNGNITIYTSFFNKGGSGSPILIKENLDVVSMATSITKNKQNKFSGIVNSLSYIEIREAIRYFLKHREKKY